MRFLKLLDEENLALTGLRFAVPGGPTESVFLLQYLDIPITLLDEPAVQPAAGYTSAAPAYVSPTAGAPVPAPAPVAVPPPAGARRRILIIEDERPLAHALEVKLTHEGFEAHVANGGRLGLKEALSGGYDAVLLDLILPEVDGYTILREMQQQHVPSVTIVLSNLGQEEDKQKALALGVKAYMVKATVPLADIVNQIKSTI